MQIQLFVGNTMTVLLSGLQFEGESDYINDAVATVSIFSSNGTGVTGETWPLTLVYVASSNGNYEAVLNEDLELAKNRSYVVEVIAEKDGNEGKWRETVVAAERRFSQ